MQHCSRLAAFIGLELIRAFIAKGLKQHGIVSEQARTDNPAVTNWRPAHYLPLKSISPKRFHQTRRLSRKHSTQHPGDHLIFAQRRILDLQVN